MNETTILRQEQGDASLPVRLESAAAALASGMPVEHTDYDNGQSGTASPPRQPSHLR